MQITLEEMGIWCILLIIIIRNVTTLLLLVDRISRQKINKDLEDLKNRLVNLTY